jgi:hypothetical protein
VHKEQKVILEIKVYNEFRDLKETKEILVLREQMVIAL